MTDINRTIEFELITGEIACLEYQDNDLLKGRWKGMKASNTTYVKGTLERKRKKRNDPKIRGAGMQVLMHRVILSRVLGRELLPNELVDHEDGNGLNNCRWNLRLASHMQNIANSRLSKANTSGYKGVFKIKSNGKWQAKIRLNGKLVSLGCFFTPEEAYEAYKAAAIAKYGKFANV